VRRIQNRAADKLRQTGLKLTPQRLAILGYLDGNTVHPSAEDIYRSVSRKYPTMSFATVYNTLDALKGRGRLIELAMDPGRRRFDPNAEPHSHLMCVRCRRIEDVHIDCVVELPDTSDKGYEVLGSSVEFYGICPACREKRVQSIKSGRWIKWQSSSAKNAARPGTRGASRRNAPGAGKRAPW
jgi:Fur family peroxide stress response transcriptional regulator